MSDLLPYEQAKNHLNLRTKVGQLFMPAAFINDTEEEIVRLENLVRNQAIGGVCFFHSRASAATNFEGRKKVVRNERSLETLMERIRRLQEDAPIPLLISIDAEWGLAMRIENTLQFPYAITLGALQEGDELIRETARHIARDCRAAGIHWNFAPVVDLNLNPDNPVIGYRAFGENREAVTARALAFMKGLQEGGLLCCAKHFPGHGDTATDSHLGLPRIDKARPTLEARELYPFKKLIAAGVDSVMVGHLAVPALTGGDSVPASISAPLIQGVLRQELGFDGAVVSDALNMHSVSRLFPEPGRLEWEAFNAGNDVLCFAENTEAGIETILDKADPLAIESAFKRIWHLKTKAHKHLDQPTPDLLPYGPLMTRLAEESLTLIHGAETELAEFRLQGYRILEVAAVSGQVFSSSLRAIAPSRPPVSVRPDATGLHADIREGENLLIALYPPSAKPPNAFGFSPELLKYLAALMHAHKVVLYTFGNPYVLNLMPWKQALAVVQAYQDFPAFQENAVRHFKGEIRAKGKLPVTLKISNP